MDSTQGFHAVMNLFLIPLWLLSGSLFPQAGAAGWVAFLMTINPLTYGVAAVRAVLYDFHVDYIKDIPDFGWSIGVTFAFGLLMFILSLMAARRRETGVPISDFGAKRGEG
jgi:ABC-2 type transport system permease protein